MEDSMSYTKGDKVEMLTNGELKIRPSSVPVDVFDAPNAHSGAANP